MSESVLFGDQGRVSYRNTQPVRGSYGDPCLEGKEQIEVRDRQNGCRYSSLNNAQGRFTIGHLANLQGFFPRTPDFGAIAPQDRRSESNGNARSYYH
jgi:hypothetical protein